jgi:CHAD domain-containing protein
MAYRIDFGCPLKEEVRRIASELLADAGHQLASQPKGPHEAIHDARKDIKRLRALYRLVASDAGDFVDCENERLREIGRALSHLRDSAALVETSAYLAIRTTDRQASTAIGHLRRLLVARRDAIADTGSDLAATLDAGRAGFDAAEKALRRLDLPILRKQSIKCVAAGWRRTGSKARTSLSSCLDMQGQEVTSDEPFHDLRKRSQDRFMHATLLRSIWPSGMVSIQRQTKALVDILGHEHDLTLLQAAIATISDMAQAERARVLAAITAERASLQQAARLVGEELFDGKPKRDAEIIAFLIRNRM